MHKSLDIKVCGLRNPENIKEVCLLEPDMVGYIFYPGSRRFVGQSPDPAIFRIPGKGIRKVGVFVDEEMDRVKQHVESCQLDLVQLHGSESPAYCESLSIMGIPLIKALDPGLLAEKKHMLEDYMNHVHYLLFDTPGKGFGGTGRKFDWDLLKNYDLTVPFFLSGGIGPGDEEELLGLRNRWFNGVDVNSRFEVSPGMKDLDLLGEFIRNIRK